MKKGSLIATGVIGLIIVAGGCITYAYESSGKLAKAETLTVSANNSSNSNLTKYLKTTFTQTESDNYYKLSQNVGDIGLPSPSMTVNLNSYKTINGINYYKTYSYDTRADYKNDTTTPTDGNYSHLLNSKIVSLDGQTISANAFGKLDFSKLTNEEKFNDIYKIASMYVEGYTANNPKLVQNSNDNYEGNLNATPPLSVNLSKTKEFNNETLYEVTVDINNFKTPIYVGLDGYVYVASQTDFYQLFFPNKLQ